MTREDPQMKLRLPPELKERIEQAAKANRRSNNAEIVDALESRYPKPPSVEETIGDIQETLKVMRHWRGQTMISVLADQLDRLIADITRDPTAPKEVKDAADEYLENTAKFTRFVPPDEF